MTKILPVYLSCLLLYLQLVNVECEATTTAEPPTTTTIVPPSNTTPPTTTTTSPPTTTTAEPPTTTTIVPPSNTTPPTTTTTSPPTTTASPTTTTTAIPTTVTVPVISRKSYTWTGSDLTERPELIFRTEDEGSFVVVTVSGVNMSDGNYLLIEAGTKHDPESVDGRVFANFVKGPLKYLFQTNAVYGFCQNTVSDQAEFTVKFEEIDGKTTTAPPTTTSPISVPPTEEGDKVYATINVSGRRLEEYRNKETLDIFKTCMVTTAENYCQEQGITLTHSITNDYVMIASITQCPYNWPDSEKCVEIKFKLPIFHDDAKWKGYQLTSSHLEIMWTRSSELDNQCFDTNNLAPYTEPDVDESVMWWAIAITLVVLFFIALLWFLKNFSGRFKNVLKRKKEIHSETASIMSSRGTRSSLSSLGPHYLQDHLVTPKLFEN